MHTVTPSTAGVVVCDDDGRCCAVNSSSSSSLFVFCRFYIATPFSLSVSCSLIFCVLNLWKVDRFLRSCSLHRLHLLACIGKLDRPHFQTFFCSGLDLKFLTPSLISTCLCLRLFCCQTKIIQSLRCQLISSSLLLINCTQNFQTFRLIVAHTLPTCVCVRVCVYKDRLWNWGLQHRRLLQPNSILFLCVTNLLLVLLTRFSFLYSTGSLPRKQVIWTFCLF